MSFWHWKHMLSVSLLLLPENRRDAYKELILFPVQAMANLYEMYCATAMNRQLAAENDVRANAWADRVEYCFRRDAELCADYNNNIAGGKWKHMMDQTHIGYTSWDEPKGGKYNAESNPCGCFPERKYGNGWL